MKDAAVIFALGAMVGQYGPGLVAWLLTSSERRAARQVDLAQLLQPVDDRRRSRRRLNG